MWYACREGCGHRERIWNSRDGVTPMFIHCPSCGGDLAHTDWNLDLVAINHKPHWGQRLFVDLSKDLAELQAIHSFRVGGYSPTVDEIKSLAKEIYGDGHRPHLIVEGLKFL